MKKASSAHVYHKVGQPAVAKMKHQKQGKNSWIMGDKLKSYQEFNAIFCSYTGTYPEMSYLDMTGIENFRKFKKLRNICLLWKGASFQSF